MGKYIKEYLLGDVVFWVCLCTSLVLMIFGFVLPPMGEIPPSTLQGVGWLFAFATLAKAGDAVRLGYNAKVQHGETSIEIKTKENE